MKTITRIKYFDNGKMLKSQEITNRFGEKFVVEIYPTIVYILKQGKRIFNVVDAFKHRDIQKAKKMTRNLLITKYSATLINEIRPRDKK